MLRRAWPFGKSQVLLMAISFGFLVRSPPKMKSQPWQIVKCQRKSVIYVHVWAGLGFLPPSQKKRKKSGNLATETWPLKGKAGKLANGKCQMQWYKCDFLATERQEEVCAMWHTNTYTYTHKVAGRDLRLCLLTLFQVDGAIHTRYTLFGSVPNSKCRGGNYWTHSHTHAPIRNIQGKSEKREKRGLGSHTHILKMQKVNDCAGKSHWSSAEHYNARNIFMRLQ